MDLSTNCKSRVLRARATNDSCETNEGDPKGSPFVFWSLFRRDRVLRVLDLNLRRFGPYDRKSRRAQLSIRYGDRNYDRSIAGLGTRKAQRYFASDFDWLSSRLFDVNGIAAVSR